MGSNMVAQWLPAVPEPQTGNTRHCSRSCIIRPVPEYFLSSANTPPHIPMTPGWFKLLPLVILILAVVILAFNSACISLSMQLVVAAAATTIFIGGGSLIIRICLVTWYLYYVHLALDLVLLILWIASLVEGFVKLASDLQELFSHATDSIPTSIIALVTLLTIEFTLVSIHFGFSAYYIHLHRKVGRRSGLVKDLEGKLITKDTPPSSIWDVGSSHSDDDQLPAVQDQVKPAQDQAKLKLADAHAFANPLEIDPLRMSPYKGTPTRPSKALGAPPPSWNFI